MSRRTTVVHAAPDEYIQVVRGSGGAQPGCFGFLLYFFVLYIAVGLIILVVSQIIFWSLLIGIAVAVIYANYKALKIAFSDLNHPQLVRFVFSASIWLVINGCIYFFAGHEVLSWFYKAKVEGGWFTAKHTVLIQPDNINEIRK